MAFSYPIVVNKLNLFGYSNWLGVYLKSVAYDSCKKRFVYPPFIEILS